MSHRVRYCMFVVMPRWVRYRISYCHRGSGTVCPYPYFGRLSTAPTMPQNVYNTSTPLSSILSSHRTVNTQLIMFIFQYMYKASFTILQYDQQTHNYFTNYHTPTRFDTTMSSSESLKSVPYQLTQVFQLKLLVIQLTIIFVGHNIK